MESNLISSTEELSPEARLLLASSKRQEPQGEEVATDPQRKMMEHQQMTAGQGQGQYPLTSGLQRSKTKTLPSSSSSEEEDEVYQNVGPNRGGRACNLSLDSNPHSTYNTLIIHHNNGSLLADTWIPASHEFTSLSTGSNRNSTCSSSTNNRKSQSPSREYVGAGAGAGGSRPPPYADKSHELSDIPREYLNQLTVLKHLAKEVQQDPIAEPPNSKLLRSASFSRSQPDLSAGQHPLPPPLGYGGGGGSYGGCSAPPPPPQYQQQLQMRKVSGSADMSGDPSSSVPSTSVQMLEILMRENSHLRAELANAKMRIQTIHKLESELTRLQKQHAALFESAERRESLERTARAKLSTEVKRLTAVNRELLSSSNSLQNLSSYSFGSDLDAYKKELSKKDMTIAQLISQNKELTTTKERQDIELAAQRATLEEQRTHIDILDSALTTAQGNVVRLEDECRRTHDYAEKVSQLQRALSSLQQYNEKREQSEKKLRTQLESEVTDLKLQLASRNAKSNTRSGSTPTPKSAPPPYPGTGTGASAPNSNSNSTQSLNLNLNSGSTGQLSTADIAPELALLQEKLRLSEEKIQSLTAVVQRWENFFTLDNGNGGGGGSGGDGKGTGPNTPSWSNSRGGTPHFAFSSGNNLEDTQSRATDLEWKIKDLESRLVEKDNMLRAMGQAYTYAPYVPTGFRESPSYTALHQHHKSNQINHQVSVSLASMMDRSRFDPMLFYEKVGKCESEPPSYANLPPKLRLGGSGSSLAKNSNESLGSAGLNGPSNATSEPESVSSGDGKNIDEQLKELNTQLLSKAGGVPPLKMQQGLCCIPGFSHPSSPTRKGKVPQPLLEGLGGGTNKPPLPRPPPSSSPSQRTSSGPPFLQPNSTPYVFSPVKGLPPKSPMGELIGSKCRSLEREQKSKSSSDSSHKDPPSSPLLSGGRCKSLDRREMKKEKKEKEKQEKEKAGGVSGKAAFFGGLLSRRSPSPARKQTPDQKEAKEKENKGGGSRFLFGGGGGSNNTKTAPDSASTSDQEIDTAFLDHQGRASQSTRGKLGLGGGANPSSNSSPWVERRKKSLDSQDNSEGDSKKWGKIVKSPFGLRYTFK